MRYLFGLVVIVAMLAAISGCGGNGDCFTPPPGGGGGGGGGSVVVIGSPVVAGDYTMSGTVSAVGGDVHAKKVTLSAILDGGVPLDLVSSDFKVFEGETELKPVTVTQLSDTTSKADVAFAVDATGSMGGAIDGVKTSIVAFADSLAGSGIDVKFAGVDFYDKVGYDAGGTPPADLGIFGKNLDKTTDEFKAWVGTLVASGGGDGPEVSVDAIYELAKRVNWRPDAQSIIIGITDIVSHQRDDGTTFALWTADEAIAACLGHIVVHTFSPGGVAPTATGAAMLNNDGSIFVPNKANPNIDIAVVANGTGGRAFYYNHGTLDLSSIPLASTISRGFSVTFTDPMTGEHKIKVVITKGGKTASIEFLVSG